MVDPENLLIPISGDNPSGDPLRYTQTYDEIKEARRADDALDQGEWQHERKASDWDQVIDLSVDALSTRTKDLQIAAWLTEALTKKKGFDGLRTGLQTINGLLDAFWDSLHPEIDDDDLEFRAGPLEFLNNNLAMAIKEAPLTDKKDTSGYSWFKWRESRDVGYEDTARDPGAREAMINEGRISGEVFDAAVARSSKAFYQALSNNIEACREAFERLDAFVDDKFGRDAPRISDIGAAILDCQQVVTGILKEKLEQEPDEEPEETEAAPAESSEAADGAAQDIHSGRRPVPPVSHTSRGPAEPAVAASLYLESRLSDLSAAEEAVWNEGLTILAQSGAKQALERMMAVAYSAPSIREKSRYQLLIAKACLEADRPDLARPIIEQLNALIEELGLEKWESPVWIGEVQDTLYRCLMAGEPTDDDRYRASELLKRLCNLDVTKALKYRM